MTSGLFGTDGVRGIPGTFPLDARTLGRIAEEAALRLKGESGGPVLIGRDTRASGAGIARALAAGFARLGCRPILDLGVLPTPAVAWLTRQRRAAFAAVVSASHNPPEFNGVKFFDGRGAKLAPAVERAIEKGLELPPRRATSGGAPRVVHDASAAAQYLDFLLSTFPADLDLSGLRLVADAAHGAASRLAGPLLRRLGAQVRLLGVKPDGSNINTGCGALEPEAMCRAVRDWGADCGFSLDGDADRVLFADETGRMLDGDALIGLVAAHLQAHGQLTPPKVALTVMSNAGLERYLAARGIGVARVPVGDRNVTEAMEGEGLALGGENSGHIVFRRFAYSGDGLLTALQVLSILRATGRRLSQLRRSVPSYPQALENVLVARRVPLERLKGLKERVRAGERRLGDGRIFIRYSGTEPVLRVLVEGPRLGLVRAIARDLAAACRKEINDHAS